MKSAEPVPCLKSLVVCRSIAEDPTTREITLVGPFTSFQASRFPVTIPLGVYAHVTDARGEYEVSVSLVDQHGTPVWESDENARMHQPNPLAQHFITLCALPVVFPCAGRFDLVLSLRGAPVGFVELEARVGGGPTVLSPEWN
jgi:hypothetical protein